MNPRSRASPSIVSTSRLLPMPASPRNTTTWPEPELEGGIEDARELPNFSHSADEGEGGLGPPVRAGIVQTPSRDRGVKTSDTDRAQRLDFELIADSSGNRLGGQVWPGPASSHRRAARFTEGPVTV